MEEKLLTNHKQYKQQHEVISDPKKKAIKQEYQAKKHYLFGDNIFQTIFFTWISPLLRYGFRFDLDEKSIPHLRDQDKPKIQFNNLLTTFTNNVINNKSKRQGLTLAKSVFQAFKKQFGLLLFFGFLITAVQMLLPILSHNVIAYIAQQQRNLVTGLEYFLAIFGGTLFNAIFQTSLWYYFAVLGFNLSNTLSLLIYNKALKHPLISQKQFAIADIINYSQVDAQRMTYMGYQLVAILYTPLQIIFSLTLLYLYIGPSFLVGLGIMILLMLITLLISKIVTKGNQQLLKAKDARMKVTEQLLNIIKFVKINALEKYFFRKLNKKRQAELRLSKKVNISYVMTIFIFWLSPPMIVSFTFLVYIAVGNQISAPKAFFTIITFNILQYPIRLLPTSITELIQIWTSVKRIQKFLLASEIKNETIEQYSHSNNNNFSIQIQRGHFLWGKQKEKQDDKNKNKNQNQQKKGQKQIITNTQSKSINVMQSIGSVSDVNQEQMLKQSLLSQNTEIAQENIQAGEYVKALHGIDLKIPSKQITMIIGDIGSGKSSLLYAILNQMTPQPEKDPKIKIFGSVAYSPQKAWIMVGTVKQNITFFQPFDEKKFNEVIHYACLEDDLRILSKGINTQIGEKGVNLSGGQKARISLARALYSDRDIYLLDDILSAVDVHVGKFLMQKTIIEYLRGKTVVMPTHAVKYLQQSDNIIIMQKGKIVASGPYKHISDCYQFQQIIKAQRKKQQQKKKEKPNKQQQSIKNNLTLLKQTTKSKQKSQQNQIENKNSINITEKIVQQLILAQDQKKGEVSAEIYLEYIKLNGGPLFIFPVVCLMSVWATLSILSNIQIEKWCQDQQKSKRYLYLYLVFGISATLFSGTRSYILVTSAIKQGRTIHKKMIKSLLYASITNFYNRVPVGRILNRLSKDLRQMDEAIGYSVGNFFVCSFSALASLVMCVYASTLYVMIPIVFVGIVCKIFLRYYLKSQRQCVRLQNVSTSPIVSGFTSTVNGVATIRAYKLSGEFINQQIQRVDTNKRMRMSREGMQSWFSLRLALLSFLINMTALAYSILSNNQNASLAGLLLTYAGMLSDDIIYFAFSYATLQLKMISLERVLTFTKLQPQAGYIDYCKEWRTKEEGFDLNAISEGTIEFKNYSTRYREGLPLVIKGINLKILKGQKVGIVGRTGAGKSTIINCLLRILDPVQGTVLIDGRKIDDYKIKDLRSCITMIEQEPNLINGSFRENLDPASIYSDEEINNILQQCNLSQLVKTKGGLDSKVTNQNLSVGQKQLLCICRAFLKKSRIILIDEATANIDVKNDKLIQEVIAKAFKESTVLTIAHRLSTLQNCDKIVVLGEGKVIQSGSTKQLKNKKGGVYKKMCEQNDSTYLL